MCEGRLYLRNPAKGQRTALEAATEFLRNQVWGGEKVIDLFHHLLADRYRETGEVLNTNPDTAAGAMAAGQSASGTDRSRIRRSAGRCPKTSASRWSSSRRKERHDVPAHGIRRREIPESMSASFSRTSSRPAILQSYTNLVNNLDNVEASSLCYLIAFDLDRFELGFALGTELSRSELVRTRAAADERSRIRRGRTGSEASRR